MKNSKFTKIYILLLVIAAVAILITTYFWLSLNLESKPAKAIISPVTSAISITATSIPTVDSYGVAKSIQDRYIAIQNRTDEKYSQEFTETLFEQVNSYRLSKGLPAFFRNKLLDQSACAKASDMDIKDYWAHIGPNNETPWKFIIESGYKYIYAGENLAEGYNDPIIVFEAWKHSKTHNDNLINPLYQDVGYCVTTSTIPSELANNKILKQLSVVQHFATPIDINALPKVF
jgi:uncharacterized protein YkwD